MSYKLTRKSKIKSTESPEKNKKDSPLMKQYEQIKSKYPGALVLFRVGDFYETFGEDAIKTSKILGILLTKRSNGCASEVELAGFPYHSLDVHLPKLVKAGNRVAICDQLEDAQLATGLVKRGVTELVTPGLSYNDQVLDQKHNNYLCALHFDANEIGVAFLDISTGEFLTAQGGTSYIEKLIHSFNPSEIVINKKQQKELKELLNEQFNLFFLEEWVYHLDFAYELLNEHFGTSTLKGFGINNLNLGIISAGAILRYLEETEHKNIKHINSISRIEEEKYVWLDHFTIQGLELISPQQENGVPLIDILDKTVTPMGARLMRKWVVLPLKDICAIQERLNIVEVFVNEPVIGQNISQLLKQIGDIERLSSKLSVGRINPREMLALYKSLQQIGPIQRQLQSTSYDLLIKLSDQLNPCKYLFDRIEKFLHKNPPLVTNVGGIILSGVNEELDELREIAYKGKDYLIQLQRNEIEKTGISSLKIGYTKIYGYYIEVTNLHKSKVPDKWIRKQTLVNGERYISEELKLYEEKIVNAEYRYIALEQKIYQELVANAAEFVVYLQQNARILAQIDCVLSFAQEARKNQYSKPVVNDSKILNIIAGRHPVIEQQLTFGEKYVPNDIYLDDQTQQIMVITGPNMAGKSAILRQVALIVLMA